MAYVPEYTVCGAEVFATWEEAFDTCRERDRPLRVYVDGEIAKIFPSGSYKKIRDAWHPPHYGNKGHNDDDWRG
jgi:hypothetical protein